MMKNKKYDLSTLKNMYERECRQTDLDRQSCGGSFVLIPPMPEFDTWIKQNGYEVKHD